MSARIGYLSALTGDGGHPASGDDRSSARGGRAPLRPPRRVFGATDFSDTEPGFIDALDFADDPGLADTPGLPDELTPRPDASRARTVGAPADHATPPPLGQPRTALHGEPQQGRAGPGSEPYEAVPGPESGDTAPGPWPRQAASMAADRTRMSENEAGDTAQRLVSARTDTSAAMWEYLVTDPDKEAVARFGAAAGVRAAGASDGRPAAPGQAPVSADWGRADVSAHAELEGNPLSPPRSVAGHQSGLDRAGAESGSASQGRVRRAPGEPWRIPRLRQAQPARDGTVAAAVPRRPGTAPVSGQEATATPSGTSYSVQRSPHDPAGPPPTRHGTGSPSGPPHVAAPAAGTEAPGIEASVAPPGASLAHRAAGPELGGEAIGLYGDHLSRVPLSDARTAEPQAPGARQPSAPGLSPLLSSGARHPGAPVTATSNSGPPSADFLLPGALADARAEASAPSAASLGDVLPPVAPTPAAQPPAALLPTVRPTAAQSPAAPRPAAHRSAASPPAARTPSAEPPAASLAGAAETSPPPPVTDRAQGRLTPAGHSAARPSGNRAEAPARPSSPTLSIGTIEVTLLPPPRTATPARPARREPPQRLSRGLGRRFGQGQA
jgi:hypothetical protein